MEKILKNLYYGDINENFYNPQKQDKNDEEYKAYEKMTATFTEEQSDLFEKFYALLMESISNEKTELYERAFKTGALIAFEIADFKI